MSFDRFERPAARTGWILGCFAIAAATTACSSEGGDGGTSSGPEQLDARPVVELYADRVHESYQQAVGKAETLRDAVEAFVTAPDAATLDSARAAWRDARPSYLQTEVFRFYGGPIDDAQTGPEGRINGWPLDEFYIDYVEGDPGAGVVNRPADFPTIDKALIAELNEKDGEKNLSAGYHAIEFLLWGQDASSTGPGDRPFSDYLIGAGATAENQDRRGVYLTAAAELLVDDLGSVAAAWEAGAAYPSAFVSDPQASLTKIITGMGSLAGAELAKERMNNAYATKDQEEEHSCFSDNTHVDHLNDALGIQNVYLGRYGDADGPGLDELVRAKSPDLDTRMQAQLQAMIDAIDAIPEPFDQAIVDEAGRKKIALAMDALDQVTDTIVEMASVLGVSINLE